MLDLKENQFSYHQLVDSKELQKLQNKFSKVTGVIVGCMDANNNQITEISGSEAGVAYYKAIVTDERLDTVLDRIAGDSIEEQAVEDIGVPNMKLAAISIKMRGELVLSWIVLAKVEEMEVDEETKKAQVGFKTVVLSQLFHILDLLRDTSTTLIRNKMVGLSTANEKEEAQIAERGRQFATIEAMTSLIQLLETKDVIESVREKYLESVGEFLQASMTQIISVDHDANEMDIQSYWCNTGIVSVFDKFHGVPAYQFLNPDAPLIVSLSSVTNQELAVEMKKYGMTALAVLPLQKQEGRMLYLCVIQKATDRTWSVAEVKYMMDANRIAQSILTNRSQQKSLESSHKALETLLDNVGCGIYVKDVKTEEILFANSKLRSVFARELQDGTLDRLIADAMPMGNNGSYYEIHYIEKDKWYDLQSTEICWMGGRRAILSSLYNISDKKNYQKKIEQQAYTDFLTGLYNRMCCERDLAIQIDESNTRKQIGALLYLDLDDFKHINDGLGHQYGDVLLKSISHSLSKIEGIKDTCYRMGGDEFVIIVPPTAYPEIDRILAEIGIIFSSPWRLKDADYYCTMSMGIVTFPDHGDSVPDLIKKADIAMYEAKRAGKNRTAFYSDDIDSASGRRLDMERSMRDATVEGYKEFEIYFQPIINIEKGQEVCAGAEALIRWNNAKMGFIPPSEFIPLAEYLGLINPIGNYVLEETCRQCKKWNDNGHPDYKVNVNLSVVQLLQPDIVETVEKTIQATGIKPQNLTLEVTESLAINDMDRMKEILGRIKKLGVKIALDDFGTGYSSLNHVREIPLDVIKVDQSFVKELAEDAYSQSFIKMVAELAETIGVSICVEGIETQKQYDVIKNMKVRYIQGFHFDRPLHVDEFERKYV